MALRPARPGDWKQLHRLCTDPAVAAGLDEIPFQPEEVFQKRLEEINPASTLALAAVDRDDGLVGCLWLEIPPVRRRVHAASLWLAVLPSHQRQGIGGGLLDAALSTADQWLNLVRLEAEVDIDNAPAQKLMARRGFAVEGRKAAARWRAGSRVDLEVYGRIRPGSGADQGTGSAPFSPASPRAPRVSAIIRASRLSDAEALAEISGEASVMWGTLQVPYPSVGVWRKRLESNLAAPDHRHVLVAEVEGKVAGMLGLFSKPAVRRSGVYQLGMSVHTALQGAGIGDQLMTAGLELAQQWLGARRVELEVYGDNTRAIALYEKHGFVREGLKRCDAWRDGGFVDSLMMARLLG